MGRLTAILLTCGCATIYAGYAASQSQGRGALDLALRLSANQVPAGIVAPDSEFTAVGGPPQRDPRGAEAFQRELPRVLLEFERLNPGFVAQELPGWILVTPTAHPQIVAELLSHSVFVAAPDGATAGDAIFKYLAGAIKGSPLSGIIGSGAMPGPTCPLGASVKIIPASFTVASFLTHVVQQVPGLVWVLTYDPTKPGHDIKFGVVCPDGVNLRMSWPRPR